jgi:hypothetical protein
LSFKISPYVYICRFQKKKKKKPKAQKTPAVSQKVSQVVKINIGDVKVKPRRKATRKPPAGGRVGFPPPPHRAV